MHCWKWDVNPVIGTGFESFWLGERQVKLNEMFTFRPNEAHNGYLETYLNLGLVGVLITVGMLFAAFFKARRELIRNSYFGRFCVAYIVSFAIYNWTEAGFRTHAFGFFVFFLAAIDYGQREKTLLEQLPEADFVEEERKLVYAPVPGW